MGVRGQYDGSVNVAALEYISFDDTSTVIASFGHLTIATSSTGTIEIKRTR